MASSSKQQEQKQIGFAVEPITDCPHIPSSIVKGESYFTPCQACQDTKENWQCLSCNSVYCSRYCQGHMKQHVTENPNHSVCVSYSDLSVWCYICDNYITHKVSFY
jgi:uncharacterized UBP type Zn finger protein